MLPQITEDSTESATTFEAAAELILAHGSRLVATETSQASQTTESRFKAITFKEGLKRKGRPKKKSKQVKFSKAYLGQDSLKKAKKIAVRVEGIRFRNVVVSPGIGRQRIKSGSVDKLFKSMIY